MSNTEELRERFEYYFLNARRSWIPVSDCHTEIVEWFQPEVEAAERRRAQEVIEEGYAIVRNEATLIGQNRKGYSEEELNVISLALEAKNQLLSQLRTKFPKI